MKDQPPIIVTGARRSGLSMTAACLHVCGADSGDREISDLSKALYENRRVIQNFIDPLLTLAGIPLDGSIALSPPSVVDVGRIPVRIRMLLEAHGVDHENSPWLLKSYKYALIWEHFDRMFPGTKWLLVKRKKEDLVRSCLNTTYMHFHSGQEGWEKWAEEWEKLVESIREGIGEERCHIFEPLAMTRGDYSGLQKEVEWLGLNFNKKAVEELFNHNGGHGNGIKNN